MPFSPAATRRFVVRSVTRPQRNVFTIRRLSESLRLDLDGVAVSFLRTSHPVETYAMRFEEGAGSIVYTSDTGLFPELERFCRGAGVLVAEATLQERERDLVKMGHMTARQTGELARDAGVGTLVLTHLWPEYDRLASLAEARGAFDGKVVLAERGALFGPEGGV